MFELICGGFGLIGVILVVKFKVYSVLLFCVEWEFYNFLSLVDICSFLWENVDCVDFLIVIYDFG